MNNDKFQGQRVKLNIYDEWFGHITPVDIMPGFVEEIKRNDGVQYIFKFDNGYGASVIRFRGSFGYRIGLWELGVIKYDKNGEWELCFDTPITDDVIGNLTEEEVKDLLKKIAELKKEG